MVDDFPVASRLLGGVSQDRYSGLFFEFQRLRVVCVVVGAGRVAHNKNVARRVVVCQLLPLAGVLNPDLVVVLLRKAVVFVKHNNELLRVTANFKPEDLIAIGQDTLEMMDTI